MAWLDDEQGVKTSRPQEIYEFVIGGTTYRYTSWETDIEYDSHTWEAVPIDRGAPGIVAQGENGQLIITIDISTDLIQDNAAGMPEFVATAKVIRLQNGVPFELARGPIAAIVLSGETARVRVGDLGGDILRVQVPSYVLSPTCQHVLYEGFCQSDPDDHDFATTVSDVDGVTLEVASVNSHPDGWYNDGRALVGGVLRYIVKQEGTTLTLLQPFRRGAVTAGTAITLFDGCRHDPEDCRDRHNQTRNYGGHPFFKAKNPFINRLAWEE